MGKLQDLSTTFKKEKNPALTLLFEVVFLNTVRGDDVVEDLEQTEGGVLLDGNSNVWVGLVHHADQG